MSALGHKRTSHALFIDTLPLLILAFRLKGHAVGRGINL